MTRNMRSCETSNLYFVFDSRSSFLFVSSCPIRSNTSIRDNSHSHHQHKRLRGGPHNQTCVAEFYKFLHSFRGIRSRSLCLVIFGQIWGRWAISLRLSTSCAFVVYQQIVPMAHAQPCHTFLSLRWCGHVTRIFEGWMLHCFHVLMSFGWNHTRDFFFIFTRNCHTASWAWAR